MFKKLIIAVAFAIALPLAMSAQKFGVVDVDAILPNLPEFKSVQEQLENASQNYQQEFSKLQEEFDKKFAEYQGLDANTPASIKERRESELQELGQKIEQFRNTASQDLQRQQQTLMAPVQQKVIDALNSVGQEGSYTFIFQAGQAAYQGKDVIDVTTDVKTKLGIQ